MLSDLLYRLRAVFGRRSVEQELDEELRFHFEHEIEKRVRAGMDPREASRQARLAVGGFDQVKEECRDARGVSGFETLFQDLRYALRGLRRNPGLTIVATFMLALGIGATAVVFSVFHAALLKPLPFRETERLVHLTETRLERGIPDASFSEANFWDIRSRNRSFQEVAAYRPDEANLSGSGPAEKVRAVFVSAGFFRTLGVSPVVGRDFGYDEVRAGFDQSVAILGYRFWKSRFGGDASVVGRALRLNGKPCTVIGVLPPGEPWIGDMVYLPLGYRPDADRGSWEFDVIGRLAPGVSLEAAAADVQRIAGSLAQSYPNDDKGMGVRVRPSSTWVAPDTTRRALWVLLGAVSLLLLIACMNIANLLLARGMARRREIAVRVALGAGRGRLFRFVMLESLLLSAFGAVLGLGLAWAVLDALRALDILGIPRLADAGLNPWVVGFAASLALASGFLSGLAPALQAPRGEIAAALRDGDRQTGNRSQSRLRAALVTAEVALSFVLLVGAGLLMRSFSRLTTVDRGFQTENRLVFSVSLPGSYWENGEGKRFLDRFFERLAAAPEVIAAGAVNQRPVEGANVGMGIDAASPGAASQSAGRRPPWAGWRIVSPAYFRAIGLPLLRGRFFDENDKPVWAPPGQPAPSRRVILSDRLARRLFAGQDPLGRHVLLWKGQANLDAEVVGIVGDSRERGPSGAPALTVYLPYGRNALTSEFVVHTRGNPLAFAPALRSMVAALDRDLPVAEVRSFDEVFDRSVAPQRFRALLLSFFAGIALLLAVTGIYGVLSYSMSRRTAEIGLRVALGASSSSILRMTIGQGIVPALAGIAFGAAGAWALSRSIAILLFGVKPFDIGTYAAVAALLLATALAACYLPGRRAMRTDPAIALRIE